MIAWTRVCFADNLGADLTMTTLAGCFEYLGGVPETAFTVAGLVVPTRPACASPPTTGSSPTSAKVQIQNLRCWWRPGSVT